MTSRVRTQKRVYTPTTNTPEPDSFLCQIIDTGECIIVQRSSLKRIYDDTAEIMLHGRRVEAKVMHRGTREDCRKFWEKKDKLNKLNTFDEQNNSSSEQSENENDEEPIEILSGVLRSRNISKSPVPHHKSSLIDSITRIENRSPPLQQVKRMKRKYPEQEAEDDFAINEVESDQENLASSSVSSIVKRIDFLVGSIRRENQQQFNRLSKKLDRKQNVDSFDLSCFRDPNNSEIFSDVDKKLLQIRGKNVGDYARKLLRAIYSAEELLSSILPPGGSQFSRKPLDNEKFEIFHKTIRAKYKIADHLYDEFYSKLVRPKLVDFLSDERKRNRKSQSIQSTSSDLDLETIKTI